MHLPQIPFAVFDTETTGFVPRIHRVIEFACIRCEAGAEVDRYEALIGSTLSIPPQIQVLTRIRPEDLHGKPSMEEIRDVIVGKIGSDTLLLGQNLGFDIGMMKGEGIDLSDRPWVDTSLLASLVFPEFASYSLGYMSAVLALPHEPMHRAMGDVRATLALFSAIWERLLQLPPERLAEVRRLWGKATPGLRILADALPASGALQDPAWLVFREEKIAPHDVVPAAVPPPAVGTIALREDSLHPDALHAMLQGAVRSGRPTVIAVKNLDTCLRRMAIPEGVSVIQSSSSLLQPSSAAALEARTSLSAEEAMVSLKILWSHPVTRNDIALHGGEMDAWHGLLACTPESDLYAAQWSGGAAVKLVDHRQLLTLLKAGACPCPPETHMIIDDASMLEDTATKAYGYLCTFSHLRAAGSDNPQITSIADALSILCEKLRNRTDLALLGRAHLDQPETVMMRTRLSEELAMGNHPQKTVEMLQSVLAMITPCILATHLVWIENKKDGSLSMHASPLRIEQMLKRDLYDRYPTTLIVPPGCGKGIPFVTPSAAAIEASIIDVPPLRLALSFTPQLLRDVLRDPPAGKTIVLASSKRNIEQYFTECTEVLEARGVALICQGFSGGQGRMEAEFLAAPGSAILMLTPWMYEGSALPRASIDHLILDQLPFDYPGQVIFSRRKDLLPDGFNTYALLRLKCRLFRLLKVCARQSKALFDVRILDPRIGTKPYGAAVQEYVESAAGAGA